MEQHPNKGISAAYEAARLNALYRYKILNTLPEEAFDDLAKLACQIFNLPVCLISFIGAEEVFYKANVGLGQHPGELRSESICTNAMMNDGVTIVEDIYSIPRFKDNPFGIRFYAGAPLITADGFRIGAICVLNHQTIDFDEQKKQILLGLAKVVLDRVELRLIALNEQKLKEDHAKLLSTKDEIVAENDHLVEFHEQVTQANSVLEDRQEHFEILFDQAPVAIGICSVPAKIIQRANTALVNIWTDHINIGGQPLEDFIPDVEGQTFLKMIDHVYETGRGDQDTEVKLQVWDGNRMKTIYVNVSLQPLDALTDKTSNVIFILADVTEQVIAKQMVEEANIVLTSAIDAGGMGYTVVEFSTGKMISNGQFKNNYGYAANDEFHYSDLFDAMLPKYRQKIKQRVQEAIENNTVYQAEYEVKWADGTIHWIRAYGKPRYDIFGRASHIIGLNKIIDAPIMSED
ncbi:MAG: PAS domain-containing protein [Pedobacter agri]